MNVSAGKAEVCPVCHQQIKKHQNRTITLVSYAVMAFLIFIAFLIIQNVRSLDDAALRPPSTMFLAIPNVRVLSAAGMRGGTSTTSLYNARDVTAEQFQKMQFGMTSEAAMKLLHYRGTVTARNAQNGNKMVARHWQNPNGTNISALFENDRLIEKMQFGLLPEPAAKAGASH